MKINSDFKDLLRGLNAAGGRYLIVGGYAVMAKGGAGRNLAESIRRRFAAFGGVEFPDAPRTDAPTPEVWQMIVLDTNVLYEAMRPVPSPEVLRWLGSHPASSLFTTATTQAEILYGLQLLPRGKRRTALESAIEAIFEEDFADRILHSTMTRPTFSRKLRHHSSEPLERLAGPCREVPRCVILFGRKQSS